MTHPIVFGENWLDAFDRRRMPAGEIEVRLPCGYGRIWHPSAAQGMIGQTTVFSFDGESHTVRVTKAQPDPDPQYVIVTLLAVD